MVVVRNAALAVSSKVPLAVLGITVVLLVPAAMLWMRISETGGVWSKCGVPPDAPPIYAPYIGQIPIVILCGAAFVMGHILSNLTPAQAGPLRDPASSGRKPKLTSQQVVVACLMLAMLGLIWYETVSLLKPNAFVAITYYVRCANVIHNFPVVAGAIAVTYFIGRWLRYPSYPWMP